MIKECLKRDTSNRKNIEPGLLQQTLVKSGVRKRMLNVTKRCTIIGKAIRSLTGEFISLLLSIKDDREHANTAREQMLKYMTGQINPTNTKGIWTIGFVFAASAI